MLVAMLINKYKYLLIQAVSSSKTRVYVQNKTTTEQVVDIFALEIPLDGSFTW
jgi:hypothetical protein